MTADRCPEGHDLTKPGSTYSNGRRDRRRCRKCHQATQRRYYLKKQHRVEIDDWVREWARAVWESWTPHERAEFAGALESLEESLKGAGDGTSAQHRRKLRRVA